MKPDIIIRREGDIGILEINNPPKNYLEQPCFIDVETIKKFVGEGIKALIITGIGRNFSAGANIESIKHQIGDLDTFKEQLIKGNQLLNYIDELDIPVVAAISGVCFGAGLEIALSCDIRYCETASLFAFPEINHDLMPGLGGVRRLIELTGKATAIELVMNGDMINAEKAFEIEIVDEVVDKKKVLDYSILMLQKMTINRPLKIVNSIMKSINNTYKLSIEETISEDAKLFSELALRAFENIDE